MGPNQPPLDLQAEQDLQGEQNRDTYQEVQRLKEKLDLGHHEVRSRDSLSIRSEDERDLVKKLVGRYRAIPEDRRRKMPALLNALGQLEFAAGDFGQAERHFKEVTELVMDPQARGQAYLNAYRAALEQRQEEVALQELLQAVRLDGKRFAPFPVGKFLPRRILGAGGFGVAFLCRHKELKADVVVKTLHSDDLARSVEDILAEARMLFQLDHPCIVRLLDCGYTVPSSKSRPYFVMTYFPGSTLEDRVRKHSLAVEDGLEIARQMGEGLQAAHAKRILHRDVKPANVLVRKDDGGWQVKLIDFGLALRTQAVRNSLRLVSAPRPSISATSFAGTIEYAAPEQMGRFPGVAVGPYSDLYGWAKTCCWAMFQTTQPLPKHWKSLPDSFAAVLAQCLEENPRDRPTSCAEVLDRLKAAKTPKAAVGVRTSVSDIEIEIVNVDLDDILQEVAPTPLKRRPTSRKTQDEDEDKTDPEKPIRASDPPKEPILMGLLSFLIVGLGQMMLGQVAKGVLILLGGIVLAVLTAGISIPIVWGVSACDAYLIAKKLKEGKSVGMWEFF